jgi:hypothetical protein
MTAMNSLHAALSGTVFLATFGVRDMTVQRQQRGDDAAACSEVADPIDLAQPRRFDGSAPVLHAAIASLVGPATFRVPPG